MHTPRAVTCAAIVVAALLAAGCGTPPVEEAEPLPAPESSEAAAAPTTTEETRAEGEAESTPNVVTPTGPAVVVDAVYVVVDKQVITVSEIARRAEPVVERILQDRPALSQEQLTELRTHVFARVAGDAIVKALILKAAREKGIVVDEARVGSQIRRLLVRKGLTLEEYLDKNTMTYQQLYKEVHDDILFTAFRQMEVAPHVSVTPSEINAYYEEHKAEFSTPEQVHCHQIIFFGNDDEKRARAEAAIEKLRAGAAFAEVAKEFSESETAADGGDLGWIARDQFNSKIINRVLFDELKVGDTSDLVEDEPGFLWIVMVSDRRDATSTSLDEAYAAIEQLLRRIKIDEATRNRARRIAKTTSIEPKEIRTMFLNVPSEPPH